MKQKEHQIFAKTVIIFFAALIICLLISAFLLYNQNQIEHLQMENLIAEKSTQIDNTISRLFYRTQTLSTFILQHKGDISKFDEIAAVIVDDPVILNILVAPDGVVSNVFPLEGNEAVLGLNFFSEGSGNREAVLAKETEQLVLGGPFTAVQGDRIIVGRLPVFIDGPNNKKEFWGLVSVTLRYPDALEGAHLIELQMLGYEYEVWRINPDDGERQVIASSRDGLDTITNYVEKQISFLNAEWFFRIIIDRPLYMQPGLWALIIVSIMISFLVAAVAQNNQDLRKLKNKLEALSNSDPLTEIYNRRYFMQAAENQMIRVTRMNSESFIIIFDLDNFKNINDKYGHQSGDIVLQEAAMRTVSVLRPYDIFARYGGEEFIIFVADLTQQSAVTLAERIRKSIANTEINVSNSSITITASFGIAPAAPVNDLTNAISFADNALYIAKQEGRDRVHFSTVTQL